MAPLISVVIPVKNGDSWLDKVIPAILSQSLAHKIEIIVVDSGSTDNTLAILTNFPIKLVQIPSSEFNHGTTRNLGVQNAIGEFVVMTVQDAEPIDNLWLENLLDGFTDNTVAAVCGQQIVPHDLDKNPVKWFRPVSPPSIKKVLFRDFSEFDELPAEEKRHVCGLDNVTTMYRRELLLKFPFKHVSFAEDMLWAYEILKAGYSIVYNTNARVNHYHLEEPEFAFKRSFTQSYHSYKIFGIKPKAVESNLIKILRHLKLLVSNKRVTYRDKWKWLFLNYRMGREINRANAIFYTSLGKGDHELERQHSILCKTPPQALKPVK
ncbi:glycosyltransferase family 2 protein [Pontibacter toksunensis]|uniref:Glycosyltransferase family 2 protein n=1 Tax=Pontibacter toksunensis TaxID=1332631 RepID=A0ABW6BMQ0_9BACT